MNTKNKSKKSGFIDLILLIVGGLLLMRHYHWTVSDVTDWIKSVSLDDVVAWVKDFLDWCRAILDSIWK